MLVLRLHLHPFRLLAPPSTLAYWQINIDQKVEAQHHAIAMQYGKYSHPINPAGRASLGAQSIDRDISIAQPPPSKYIVCMNVLDKRVTPRFSRWEAQLASSPGLGS
jgi:hypothetical protein